MPRSLEVLVRISSIEYGIEREDRERGRFQETYRIIDFRCGSYG